MIDTPRCNALESNPLDSFDFRAWKTLARQLEREMAQAKLPVIGECEDCGHKIVTSLKRIPAASMPSKEGK